jgi:hypothetical protein
MNSPLPSLLNTPVLKSHQLAQCNTIAQITLGVESPETNSYAIKSLLGKTTDDWVAESCLPSNEIQTSRTLARILTCESISSDLFHDCFFRHCSCRIFETLKEVWITLFFAFAA